MLRGILKAFSGNKIEHRHDSAARSAFLEKHHARLPREEVRISKRHPFWTRQRQAAWAHVPKQAESALHHLPIAVWNKAEAQCLMEVLAQTEYTSSRSVMARGSNLCPRKSKRTSSTSKPGAHIP